MRSVIISTVLLLTVFVCVIMNMFYMASVCGRLDAIAGKLPVGGEAVLSELEREWHKNASVMIYFSDYREVDRVHTALNSMRSSFDKGDAEGFDLYLEEFRHAVLRLRNISSISPENIL